MLVSARHQRHLPARAASDGTVLMTDARRYPDRPYLAASAAIIRDGKVLVVRRAQPPAGGLFSLPGGVVEVGETLHEAVAREVREETSLTIEPVALAGFRETIVRDQQNR